MTKNLRLHALQVGRAFVLLTPCCPVIRRLTAVVLLLGVAAPVLADSYRALHLSTPSNPDLATAISTGAPVSTSLQALNDVTIRQLSSPTSYFYQQTQLGGATPGNNPSYLTGFTGSVSDFTGSGSPGSLYMLGLEGGVPSLQFDFSVPLNSADRILIADVDRSQRFRIEAFRFTGSSYQPLSLTGWIHEVFSGETGILPNANWATWDSNLGTLTASTSTSLTTPLNSLTPNQSVDRLVFSRVPGSNLASVEIQLIHMVVPEPSSMILAGIGIVIAVTGRRQLRKCASR